MEPELIRVSVWQMGWLVNNGISVVEFLRSHVNSMTLVIAEIITASAAMEVEE